jgi:biofilm protein TabA
MIYGHINEKDQWSFLTSNPVWKQAFDWLLSLPEKPELGKYPLMGDEMFAVVMEYDTVEPAESKFETHRKYVDLQFTISGGEGIAWEKRSSLEPAGEYDDGTDLQFYKPAGYESRVQMNPGNFGIFFNSDAHLPKLADGKNPKVFKAVIKVAAHLVS